MALNYYEIELKAGALTSYDLLYSCHNSLRIFSGVITSSTKYSAKFSIGNQVICYIPSIQYRQRTEEDIIIATVAEEYIILKSSELSFETSVVGIATVFKSLCALHYSLSVLQNETILIINSDFTTVQIAVNLGLTVFYTGKEDFRIKTAKMIEIPEALILETGGLGVNHVLDFLTIHDYKAKKSIIDCLGIRAKWAVCDSEFQLDPPESYQLFMRNASLCWFNENV